MRVIRKSCLGLDLHKKQITAHLRVHRGSSHEPEGIDVRFGTMPDELLRLREWVIEHQVTDVVMESTSVYWMHVYDLLEDVTTPAVVNAAHAKNVPGRKTDVSDACWLSEIHAHGLIRVSFVPPKEIRELRCLTRYRTKLVATRTAARNRTIKLVEMAGIKLSSVVCDSFGRTGRAMLDALVKGPVNGQMVVDRAKGSLRKKTAEIEAALRAPMTPFQRHLLGKHLDAFDLLDTQVAELECELTQKAKCHGAILDKLDAVPGINQLAAITVLAETGVDMSVYRDAHHLTALAGLAPGNSISDSKRRRIGVRKGNRYLKRICVQIAWAAARKRDSFFSKRFSRLAYRIGQNKAIVATARHILIVVFHLIAGTEPYQDLGTNFYDRKNRDRSIRTHLKKLQELGVEVFVKTSTP